MRTSASETVFSSPTIRTSWPRSGCDVRMRHVCTTASPAARDRTAVTGSTGPENVDAESQAKVAEHWRLEQHREAVGSVLRQFEIRGPTSCALGRRKAASVTSTPPRQAVAANPSVHWSAFRWPPTTSFRRAVVDDDTVFLAQLGEIVRPRGDVPLAMPFRRDRLGDRRTASVPPGAWPGR